MQIEITFDRISPMLRVFGAKLQDATIPITGILEMKLSDARAAIAGKTSMVSGAWAPMKPFTTLFFKRDPFTLLDDTGALMDSLQRGGGGNIFTVGPNVGEAGTALKQGKLQQLATSKTYNLTEHLRGRPGKFITPGRAGRAFLEFDVDDPERATKIFADYIMGGD